MNFRSTLNGAKLMFSFALLTAFSTVSFAQFDKPLFQYKSNYLSYENIGSKLRTRPRIYVEPTKELIEAVKPTIEAPKSEAKVISTVSLEQQAFALLNQKRIENGLPPITWNEDVAKIARIHSQNMAQNNFFSHQGLDGSMVNNRADAFGVRNWRSIGENIACNRGYDNPVEFAVLRWMQSQSHRANLMSDKWKESGVGIAVSKDGKTFYFTQVFVLRK